jgi:hypothetical protein
MGLVNTAYHAIAPMVKATTPGYATSATPIQTEIGNPTLAKIGGAPQVLFSQQLNKRLTAASIATTTWFAGDVTEYAEYREVWPITFTTFGSMGQLEFQNDVVQQFKASGMGAYRVKQPRAMTRNNA